MGITSSSDLSDGLVLWESLTYTSPHSGPQSMRINTSNKGLLKPITFIFHTQSLSYTHTCLLCDGFPFIYCWNSYSKMYLDTLRVTGVDNHINYEHDPLENVLKNVFIQTVYLLLINWNHNTLHFMNFFIWIAVLNMDLIFSVLMNPLSLLRCQVLLLFWES